MSIETLDKLLVGWLIICACVLTWSFTRQYTRCEAVEAGVAHWRIVGSGGCTEFVWGKGEK